jgi:hypothetical protein
MRRWNIILALTTLVSGQEHNKISITTSLRIDVDDYNNSKFTLYLSGYHEPDSTGLAWPKFQPAGGPAEGRMLLISNDPILTGTDYGAAQTIRVI